MNLRRNQVGSVTLYPYLKLTVDIIVELLNRQQREKGSLCVAEENKKR